MNLRPILHLVVLLLLFSGCSHVSYDIAGSPDSSAPKEIPPLQTPGDSLEKDPQTSQVTEWADFLIPELLQVDEEQSESASGIAEDNVSNIASNTIGLGIETAPAQKVQTNLDEALELCQISQDHWQQGELENAVEALDRAYAFILDVDTSDRPKMIQQKEDLRFMISKRILEIYASRNIVVNGNHNAIPVAINRHVQAEIDLFTTGREKRTFIDAYKRSGRYRKDIVSALHAAGLPTELSWLPLIESSYKVNR